MNFNFMSYKTGHQARSILTIPHHSSIRSIYVTNFCLRGYTLVGSSNLTCASGLWRNDSVPLCKSKNN